MFKLFNMKKTYMVPTLTVHRLTVECTLVMGSKIDVDYGESGIQTEAESKRGLISGSGDGKCSDWCFPSGYTRNSYDPWE